MIFVQMALLIKDGVSLFLKLLPFLKERITTFSRTESNSTFSDFYDLASSWVSDLATTQESLIVVKSDTTWFWTVGPSIFRLRLEGKLVKIICKTPLDDREKIRTHFLEALGCSVKFTGDDKFFQTEMILLDANKSRLSKAFTFYPRQNPSQNLYATKYAGAKDEKVVKVLQEKFEKLWAELPECILRTSKRNKPTLARVERSLITERLGKGVKQFQEDGVSISFESIPVEKIRFFSRKLYRAKYEQVKTTLSFYNELDVSLFEPIKLDLDEGRQMIITPPVVEARNGLFYLLTGSHRVYFFIRNKLGPTLQCIVAKNVKASLPGKPAFIWQVSICNEQQSHRVKGLKREEFRHVEAAMHQESDLISATDPKVPG